MTQDSILFSPLANYWTDAWQRSVLFFEALNERGNIQRDQAAKEAPHVLSFPAEVVLDGRTLDRPVNYLLVRIIAPTDVAIDPLKPPIVVVDPRAGHGPGIGGMKSESEIGVALRAGHAVYFVGFLPKPMPAQTIEDVCRAEAVFLEEVAKRHPEAEGKPIVIANCQAGWQMVMTTAIRPGLVGVIMLAGAPLSYWAGVRGKNPMRYLGGTNGGTWLTAVAGDMGAGIFDGASLIANFESLNPANTYWTKPYNVYSKVNSETERFLEFETWWGNPVLLNAGEMQWIADNLFVGNKLSTGELRTSDGVRDRSAQYQVADRCFCSWGDDITPPQQALDWILDLYDDVGEIVANGQTIVYSLHHDRAPWHLRLRQSRVQGAREFVSCMEMIEATPPASMRPSSPTSERTRRTATWSRASISSVSSRERSTTSAPSASTALRTRSASQRSPACPKSISASIARSWNLFFAPQSPSRWPRRCGRCIRTGCALSSSPTRIRSCRRSSRWPRRFAPTGSRSTPTIRCSPMEKQASSLITAALDSGGKIRDAMTEAFFLTTYGSPLLQAMVGLGTPSDQTPAHIERDLVREAAQAELRVALDQKFEEGGVEEAFLRALIYVRGPEGGFDERGYRMLKNIRETRKSNERMSSAIPANVERAAPARGAGRGARDRRLTQTVASK